MARPARCFLGLCLLLLVALSQAFVRPASPLAAVAGRRQAARRAAPKMSLASSPLDTVAASLTQQPLGGGSSVVVADYFSTVDEIARGIGDRPWLQYFIPTAVGMSISLAIVFSLYLAAQPYEPPSK